MIKKCILLFSIILISIGVYNSTNETTLYIPESKPIEPFKRLIYAIGMVEGRCDTFAYNPVENAVGYFQIRPVRLKDYNKRTNSNYTMNDLWDYNISEKIFLYYATLIGPYDYEKIARCWNGGPYGMYILQTKKYYKNVLEYL